jgi:hypothetical protein
VLNRLLPLLPGREVAPPTISSFAIEVAEAAVEPSIARTTVIEDAATPVTRTGSPVSMILTMSPALKYAPSDAVSVKFVSVDSADAESPEIVGRNSSFSHSTLKLLARSSGSFISIVLNCVVSLSSSAIFSRISILSWLDVGSAVSTRPDATETAILSFTPFS